jgi:Flp pilus assembly CpaE family ATPase
MTNKPSRILLLEDDPGDARLLRMMLEQAAAGQFELTRVERLSDALRLLGNATFEVILADLLVPDSRGLATFSQLQAQAPHVPIVVFSGLMDESVAIRAVQQGAQDYLIKGQVNGASLVRSIRYAMERSRSPEAASGKGVGKVVSFLGTKGGVGTTTTALNVAAALAKQKNRVIIVELQPSQGPLAFLLRQTPAWNLGNILDGNQDAMNAKTVADGLVSLPFGLQILFAPQKPDQFKEIQPGQARGLVHTLSGMADYTILDLPSRPSPASQAATQESQFVALVVENDPVGVACGKMFHDVLRAWGVPESQTGAVVVNRVPVGMPMDARQVGVSMGCPVVGVIPAAVDALIQAQKAGSPLIISQAQNPAAIALTELAQRLMAEKVAAIKFE